ncbi:glycyl-tRNA synthetase beta subunit, partial [Chlamydia psittaci 84-8471/1]
SSVKLT